MSDTPPEKPAPEMHGYGVLMALGTLAGLAVGIAIGEPSAGTVGGCAVGLVAAIALWARRA